jgi:hypothetical protein
MKSLKFSGSGYNNQNKQFWFCVETIGFYKTISFSMPAYGVKFKAVLTDHSHEVVFEEVPKDSTEVFIKNSFKGKSMDEVFEFIEVVANTP